MSSVLLGAAFRAQVFPPAYKLVLPKLVDAARDDGTRIYPSVETIATAAGVSRRHTKRVLHGFVDAGLLSITEAGGKGPGDATQYALNVGMMESLQNGRMLVFANGTGTVVEKGDTESPLKDDTMSPLKTVRVTSETAKGDSGVTQPLIDPLVERERARARGRGKRAESGIRTRPTRSRGPCRAATPAPDDRTRQPRGHRGCVARTDDAEAIGGSEIS